MKIENLETVEEMNEKIHELLHRTGDIEKYLNILAKHINVNWNISEYYIKGIKEILEEHKREIYSKMEKARNDL